MVDFDKVLKLENNNASAHYNKGICLSNFKKYLEAKKSFQNAVKLNPNNELYYSTLGDCLRKLKKHKEAIEMYDKGKEIKKLKSADKIIINEDKKINSKRNFVKNINKKNINKNVNTNKIVVFSPEKLDAIIKKTRTNKNFDDLNEKDKIGNKINNVENNKNNNDDGLISQIKEVLNGNNTKDLLNKLDFSKVVNMKLKIKNMKISK